MNGMDGMAAYERRCRQLLRAYPRHYRERRGSELLGTLLDAARPGCRRPTMRDGWDLVRGGLATRLRHRPGLWRWIGYRFGVVAAAADGQEAQRLWARDDLLSPWFRAKYAVAHTLVHLPWMYGPALATDISGWYVVGSTAGMGGIWLILLLSTRTAREQLLAKHGFQPDGTALAPGDAASDDRGDDPAVGRRRRTGGLLVIDRR